VWLLSITTRQVQTKHQQAGWCLGGSRETPRRELPETRLRLNGRLEMHAYLYTVGFSPATADGSQSAYQVASTHRTLELSAMVRGGGG
jgi:hypothetical protein